MLVKVTLLKVDDTMSKLEDVIHTEDYGDIEIWSQDDMEYFFQDKMPQDDSELY